MEREAVPRVGVEEGREACVHVNVTIAIASVSYQ